MHEKKIKLQIKRQLKKRFPNWSRMTKKEKKELCNQVMVEVTDDYDYKKEIDEPVESLLGIDDQCFAEGIMDVNEMEHFVENFYNGSMMSIRKYKRPRSYITDKELKFIDDMMDNEILNSLLSYDGYTPSMRDFFPCNFFKAELLKSLKYPEIGYRKYCTKDYFGLHQKENLEFMGLPVHKKKMIDHTQLCKFRSNLAFSQIANVLVYILYHFFKSGILSKDGLFGVDSTELANEYCRPICTIEVKGKNKDKKIVKIYTDLDCDCGTRRKKRDKSTYFVGYRLHTLTAINAKTGHNFPLMSLLAPGNHHDSNFLKPLVKLAQKMGIEMKLITADEAYHDKDGSLFNDTDVRVITPPDAKVELPENVETDPLRVYCNENCEIPMERVGSTDMMHEYKCNAENGECTYASSCHQYREIPLDSGIFQRIPIDGKLADEAISIRKNSERPFNLLKKREGLEQVRVRSQGSLIVKCAVGNMATLLIEMAGFRKKKKKNMEQMELFKLAS